MMPPPEEVATLIDRAERLPIIADGRVSRFGSEERRRMLAWAIFEELRHQRQDQPELVPVSA